MFNLMMLPKRIRCIPYASAADSYHKHFSPAPVSFGNTLWPRRSHPLEFQFGGSHLGFGIGLHPNVGAFMSRVWSEPLKLDSQAETNWTG
jgi:hypothetical protein